MFDCILIRQFIDTQFIFFQLAYRCQRHEFKKHAPRQFVFAFVLLFCLCLLFWLKFERMFVSFCDVQRNLNPELNVQYDEGVCDVFLDFTYRRTNA